MQIRCPHCHNPLDIASGDALSDIPCPSCGSTFSLVPDETMAADSLPQQLAQFKLVQPVGWGAFGVVWRAEDTELKREVAIKIPRKEELDSRETEKFLREAQAAAQLRHPNIVGIHEVGREASRVYLVSDFVNGVTLSDFLSAKKLTARESAEFCATLADALHYAHQQGVVHRDLKPSNIILDQQSQPHIMDFGLAKHDTGEVTMTADGRILGTPAYMSPEQAQGEGHDSDSRSDIYSLGVILFELLTGELPFRGTTRMLLHQVINEEPPALRRLNATVPRDLETICLKCLEKEPHQRYRTAAELALDLRRFLNDEPIAARPHSAVERTMRWARRNPTVAWLASAVVLLLLLGTSVSIFFAARSHERALAAEQNLQRALQEQAAAERARAEARRQADRADRAAQQAQADALDAQRARRAAQWKLQRAELTRQALMNLATPDFLGGAMEPAYRLLTRPIQLAQESAASAAAANSLGQIYQALISYQQAHGHLPPAVIYGPDGRPWHSWRVLLLPELGEGDLFQRYRFDEPWNGPRNRRLLREMPIVFADPRISDSSSSMIVAITGPGTAFPLTPIECDRDTKSAEQLQQRIDQHASQLSHSAKFPDAAGYCLLAGTAARDLEIPWTKPQDVLVSDDLLAPGPKGGFGTPFHTSDEGVHGMFAFANGLVAPLPEKLDPAVFRQLARVDDGVPETRQLPRQFVQRQADQQAQQAAQGADS